MTESKTYSIDADLEAALLAAASSGQSVRVKGTKTHCIQVVLQEDDIWSSYDPDALLQTVEESAQHPYSVDPADLDGLLSELNAARDQDSSGRPAEY